MASKAEEFGAAFPMMASLFRDVDAEAFARGRAEGAEQKRLEIWNVRMGPICEGGIVRTTMPDSPCFLVPASVLAPEVKP